MVNDISTALEKSVIFLVCVKSFNRTKQAFILQILLDVLHPEHILSVYICTQKMARLTEFKTLFPKRWSLSSNQEDDYAQDVCFIQKNTFWVCVVFFLFIIIV